MAAMTQTFRNQIVGLIRFSYPATDGFRMMDPEPAAQMARLYAPDRLAFRFRLLERLALPSLRAQTDVDFALAVLIGDDLPAQAVARLGDAVAGFAKARIVALPPMVHLQAAQTAMAAVIDAASTHVTGFRLDDDDAVDRGFIARLRARAAILAPMNGLQRPVVIANNSGLVLQIQAGGHQIFEVTEKLPIGIGLAMTAPRSFRGGIFRRNHRLLPQFFSTFSDVDTPSFIRTVHPGNDSQPQSSGVSRLLTDPQAEAILGAHFPYDVAALRAL